MQSGEQFGRSARLLAALPDLLWIVGDDRQRSGIGRCAAPLPADPELSPDVGGSIVSAVIFTDR
jgi:hypothetical protein